MRLKILIQILTGMSWSKMSVLAKFWQEFSSLAGQGWSKWFQVKFLDFLKNIKISLFHQILSFFPRQPKSKLLDFAKFLSGQKCQFWAKFSTWLKMSAFCQLSAFPGPEWSKMSILIQILTGTKNFRILPNFSLEVEWQKSHFWAIKTNQNFSGLCQISSFAVSEWTKLSFLSQIFNATENFLIWPNFLLCMSLVFKTLKFCAKFSKRLKIFEFCQISSYACPEWSKMWPNTSKWGWCRQGTELWFCCQCILQESRIILTQK